MCIPAYVDHGCQQNPCSGYSEVDPSLADGLERCWNSHRSLPLGFGTRQPWFAASGKHLNGEVSTCLYPRGRWESVQLAPQDMVNKTKTKSTRVGRSVSAVRYCTSELTTHQSRQNDTTAQTQNRKVSAQLSSKKMAGNRISECQNTAWVIEPYAT